MNFSSWGLAWTNSTSASPRRPVSSAWPVPCATTFTSIPVWALNNGRIWPNMPESCVEVVEATTIDLSCACTGETASMAMVAARMNRRRVGIMFVVPCFLCPHGRRSNEEFAGDESVRVLACGCVKEGVGRTTFDHAPAMHENDVTGEPSGLVKIMRRHHHLDAARDD